MRIVERDAFARIERLIVGKKANGGPKKLAKGTAITKDYLDGGSAPLVRHPLADEDVAQQLEQVKEGLEQARKDFDVAFEEKRKKLTQGDELPPGVQKMVKVYVAVKRRLQPGDKMARPPRQQGRRPASCRWKTCRTWPTVSPVDIVLNPLGVPSG